MSARNTEDIVDALYADWLMAQPEAAVCNGDVLVKRMESRWGWDEFIAQAPQQLINWLKTI